MKHSATISRITTIICCIMPALSLPFLFVGIAATVCSGDVFQTVQSIIENAGSHELTGGYEVLGGLGLALFDGLLFIGGGLALLAGIFYCFPCIIPAISGLIFQSEYRKTGDASFIRRDAVVKLLDFSFSLALYIVSFISISDGTSFSYMILPAIPYLVLLSLSVLQLVFLPLTTRQK